MSGDKTVYAAAKLAGVRLVAAERNAPTIYHIRYGFMQRCLSFGMLHLADRIAIQMPEFISGYPASLRDRIHVIPNPVVPAQGRAQPDEPTSGGRFNLLAVGRLDIQKGYEGLVRAFAHVANRYPCWQLRIVGDGALQESLRRLAAERGVADRVLLEPWTSSIHEAYKSSHLFVMPSRWEGFPNALTEAMSHGLPGVGFRDAAGVAQLIDDGKTGWLANGLDDEASLARVLAAAMSDRCERTRRGLRAAESMAVYAPEIQFDRWANLLKTLRPDTIATQA
jgi:glycosyltransferase involved in cell wall biosynthesis